MQNAMIGSLSHQRQVANAVTSSIASLTLYQCSNQDGLTFMYYKKSSNVFTTSKHALGWAHMLISTFYLTPTHIVFTTYIIISFSAPTRYVTKSNTRSDDE